MMSAKIKLYQATDNHILRMKRAGNATERNESNDGTTNSQGSDEYFQSAAQRHQLQMKSNFLASQPFVSPGKLTAFNTKSIRRNGVIKLLPAPAPPDEKTIRELNELAAKHPFCSLHKVKKHDPL